VTSQSTSFTHIFNLSGGESVPYDQYPQLGLLKKKKNWKDKNIIFSHWKKQNSGFKGIFKLSKDAVTWQVTDLEYGFLDQIIDGIVCTMISQCENDIQVRLPFGESSSLLMKLLVHIYSDMSVFLNVPLGTMFHSFLSKILHGDMQMIQWLISPKPPKGKGKAAVTDRDDSDSDGEDGEDSEDDKDDKSELDEECQLDEGLLDPALGLRFLNIVGLNVSHFFNNI
jgi:hypothetical protein